VTPLERDLLKEHLPLLQSLGIQIEEFGHNSFIVQGVPQIFSDGDIAHLIHEILHSLKEYQDSQTLKVEKEKVIALAASRASVSKKSQISIPEAQSLVNQLMRCEKPNYCPLGKPTIIEISHEEIAKQFQK
jgi:DNA mismatch repair protein MutL